MLFESIGQGYIFLILFCFGVTIGCIGIFIAGAIRLFCCKIKIDKKSTKNNKKIQFNQKKDKKIQIKNKINFRNLIALLAGFLQYCVLGVVLVLVVCWLDYGAFRLYHFLALFGGFALTKAIFAKLKKRIKNSAKI